MKKYIPTSVLLLLIIVGASGSVFAQKSKADTVRIKTSAICDMCKAAIESDMAYEKGVKYLDLDLESAVLEVVYNPKKTDPHKLRVRLNEIGYDADTLKAYPIAFDRLPECCKDPSIDSLNRMKKRLH